jgi:hypothetical protein
MKRREERQPERLPFREAPAFQEDRADQEEIQFLPMVAQMDARVCTLAAFMQENFLSAELRGLAAAIATVAPALWSQHPYEAIRPLQLSVVRAETMEEGT